MHFNDWEDGPFPRDKNAQTYWDNQGPALALWSIICILLAVTYSLALFPGFANRSRVDSELFTAETEEIVKARPQKIEEPVTP